MVSLYLGSVCIYDLTGIRGIKYIKNGQISDYGFIKDGLNNVVGIVSSGLSVVEYTYDAWGSSSVTREDDANNIGNLNPFRWKSHYYDNETGMYYINGRYYEDEVGQFITPNYSSINPLIIGGVGGGFYNTEGWRALAISLGLGVGKEITNWLVELLFGRFQ